MLTNATITRIDAPATRTALGGENWTPGSTIALRCSWQRPRASQRQTLGAAIAEASAVIYVPGNVVATVRTGGRVVVRVDLESSDRTYRVLASEPAVGPGGTAGRLTNTEVYVQAA